MTFRVYLGYAGPLVDLSMGEAGGMRQSWPQVTVAFSRDHGLPSGYLRRWLQHAADELQRVYMEGD